LHLAASYGFTTIAEYLIDCGHEQGDNGEPMISRNNDWETPLMLACSSGKEECGVMLCKRFPESVAWKDKKGGDALMLAAKSGSGTLHLMPTLILYDPNILVASDDKGDTALHHASAAGELKAMRMLLSYGANPLASNGYSWTPVHYSATSAAEAYFKTLIIEFEKKKAEGKRAVAERERQQKAGVRLVTDTEGLSGSAASGNVVTNAGIVTSSSLSNIGSVSTNHASSASATFTTGAMRERARDDAAISGLPAPGLDWSPVEKRRAMTPTEGRGWHFTPEGMRPRAETGGSI
jgi:hypothetical protein